MANEHPTEAAPIWEEVVAAYAAAAIDKLDGPMLARVETYDGKHSATIKPLSPVPVNGTFSPSPVFSIGVGWSSDAGPAASFAITFPLKVGSICEIVPHKYDQTPYTESASILYPEPPTERRHDLTDAIARPLSAAPGVPLPINAFASDGMVLFAQPFVYLGGADATDFVALASLANAEVLALVNYLKTLIAPGGLLGQIPLHTHLSALPGVPSTPSIAPGAVPGPSGYAVVSDPAVGGVGSTVVKSK